LGRVLDIVLAVAIGALLMGRGSEEREARRERWTIERRGLETTFDDLGARLLVTRARVQFWEEMRERRQEVTAIACGSHGRHAREMTLVAEAERKQLRRLGRGGPKAP
jgi:hypothetical protein